MGSLCYAGLTKLKQDVACSEIGQVILIVCEFWFVFFFMSLSQSPI